MGSVVATRCHNQKQMTADQATMEHMETMEKFITHAVFLG